MKKRKSDDGEREERDNSLSLQATRLIPLTARCDLPQTLVTGAGAAT